MGRAWATLDHQHFVEMTANYNQASTAKSLRRVMPIRTAAFYFAVLASFCIGACASPSRSSASDTKGQEAVHRFIAAEKHWNRNEYRVGKPTPRGNLVAYDVIFLGDF